MKLTAHKLLATLFGKPCHDALKCRNITSDALPTNLTEEKQFIITMIYINMIGELCGWWIDTCLSSIFIMIVLCSKHTQLFRIRVKFEDVQTINDAGTSDVEIMVHL